MKYTMKYTMNSIIYNSSVVSQSSASKYAVRPVVRNGTASTFRMNLQNPMLGRIAGVSSGCGCGH